MITVDTSYGIAVKVDNNTYTTDDGINVWKHHLENKCVQAPALIIEDRVFKLEGWQCPLNKLGIASVRGYHCKNTTNCKCLKDIKDYE